jgi:IS1 family transposase
MNPCQTSNMIYVWMFVSHISFDRWMSIGYQGTDNNVIFMQVGQTSFQTLQLHSIGICYFITLKEERNRSN